MKELNEIIEKYKKNLFDYQRGYRRAEFFLSKTGQFSDENKKKCRQNDGLKICHLCGGRRLIRKRKVDKPPEICQTCNGYGFLILDWISEIKYPGAKFAKIKK